jgi:purine-binding chemotaxis protein CheW
VNAAARPFASQQRWVTFTLDSHRCALPLDSVTRIVRAAEITPLPHSPDAVAGVIDVGGTVLPVFDLRRHLHLPARPLALSDQFIIVRTARRELVLVVDSVPGLIDGAATALPEVSDDGGLLLLADGLVLIHDLERVLTPGEEAALAAALQAAEAQRAG